MEIAMLQFLLSIFISAEKQMAIWVHVFCELLKFKKSIDIEK